MQCKFFEKICILFVAKGNAPFVKAVWCKLHAHSVPGHYADIVHSHFASYVA